MSEWIEWEQIPAFDPASMKPVAEVWCYADHGSGGRPHRYRLLTVYWTAGRDGFTYRYWMRDRDLIEIRQAGEVIVKCPWHGEATVSTESLRVPYRPGKKPRAVEVRPS